MKKQIVLALIAVIAIAETAEAQRRRGSEPPAVAAARTARAREGARDAVTTHGADAASARPMARLKNDTSLLSGFDAISMREISKRQNEKFMEDLMKDILENGTSTPALQRLSIARLKAALILPKNFDIDIAAAEANLTAEGKAVLAFAKFVTRPYTNKFSEGTTEATTYLIENATRFANAALDRMPPEQRDQPGVRENLIAQGMKIANDGMAKTRAEGGLSVRLDTENVNKYCK